MDEILLKIVCSECGHKTQMVEVFYREESRCCEPLFKMGKYIGPCNGELKVVSRIQK